LSCVLEYRDFVSVYFRTVIVEPVTYVRSVEERRLYYG